MFPTLKMTGAGFTISVSYRQEPIRPEISGLRFAALEMTGAGRTIGISRRAGNLTDTKNPLQCGEDFLLYFTDYRPNLAKISSTCFSMGL